MGKDIHLNIVQNGEYIKKEIFDGRNSEWFANLEGDGWDDCYDHLDTEFGLSPQAPKELNIEKMREEGYFNFYYINVKKFKEWFQQYRPDIDAGWVSTYDKWRIENKGYIPENIFHYLSEVENPADMHFIEITNQYDCSAWLFTYLVDHKIDDNADITYWFDW